VSAINQQTAAFIDPSTGPTLRQEALKFILHFIGDIHQPLHVENVERGGNEISVCWHKACHHNLHSVWDTTIPHQICGLKTSRRREASLAIMGQPAIRRLKHQPGNHRRAPRCRVLEGLEPGHLLAGLGLGGQPLRVLVHA
jgi:hypothetical protein